MDQAATHGSSAGLSVPGLVDGEGCARSSVLGDSDATIYLWKSTDVRNSSCVKDGVDLRVLGPADAKDNVKRLFGF